MVLSVGEIVGGPAKEVDSLLDSRLSQLEDILRNEGLAAARAFAAANGVDLDAFGRVNVLIHEAAATDFGAEREAFGDGPERPMRGIDDAEEALFAALEVPIEQALTQIGGEFRGRVANLINASVPIANLSSLDGSPAIGWVEASLTRRTSVISQGVNTIRANTLQASPVAYQPDDMVKVGVVDIGFKGWESLRDSGELPANTMVNSFHPGGIDGNGESLLDQYHGSASAEIVFDVAPNIELYLANFNSLSDNLAAVDWMISQGVNVISYSIGWFNAGPGDGTGPVNSIVQKALDAGIEWVSSAGNEARSHWQGQFSDPDGDGNNDFGPGDESNAIFMFAGDRLDVFLNWDDWFASDQDYDLYLLDAAGTVVAASIGAQTGSQSPAESFGYIAPANGVYHIVITKFAATRDVTLEIFVFSAEDMQYLVPAGSLTIPADTRGSVAVGASFWSNDVIESFSSRGPTADGRTKPDLVAPDGVATVSFGQFGFQFFGTSAAAPHMAGAIALMKGRFGVFTMQDIRQILYARAIDKGVAGDDDTYGRGRLDVIGQ